MRVIIGLALLAVASAQPAQWASSTGPGVLLYGNAYGTSALPSATGTAALAAINVYTSTATSNPQAGGAFAKVTVSNGAGQVPASNVNVGTGTYATTNNYLIQVANNIPYVVFVFNTNTYTGQLQHRWSPNYNPGSGLSVFTYTCDLCSGPNGLTSATACNTPTGPGTVSTTNGVGSSPSSGYLCSSLARTYTFGPLNPGVNGGSLNLHTFAVQLFDLTPLASSYSFQIYRAAPNIIGDPQISGMQGQDFQVHGMPDEVFNMITYPNLQVNARFVYLSNGECHDNFTACFAHPGTYISDEGIRLGSDKIHVRSGSFKKGLSVSVNGQKVSSKTTSVKLGKIELVNHRRVVISTPIMTIQISNSDKFLNQEVALKDTKLLALGSERRSLKDGESFHTEIPLHGLQGQTWRNVEYPSGLEYEGSILDYHVVSGDLFGNDFVFNKFQ